MFKSFLLVGIGSFFGGGFRYLLSSFVGTHMGTGFPWGTFAVNVIGCFIIGGLSALAERDGFLPENVRLLLTVGLCGGFTTFSTFANESFGLLRSGHWLIFSLYILLSLVVGIAALVAAYKLLH